MLCFTPDARTTTTTKAWLIPLRSTHNYVEAVDVVVNIFVVVLIVVAVQKGLVGGNKSLSDTP